MQITPKVKEILSWYEGENPGVKGNLARLLMHGRLAGSGRLVILPVDQGYEHGPARSFASNPPAYDPHYLYQLALDAGLSGYAAPLGLLEQGADTYAGQLPTILKMNSANSLAAGVPDQAVTGSVNQKGDIQSIGGINYKIEGFYDVCKAKGLTGAQGVLLPIENVPDLMLRPEVAEAVRAGKFHLYPVASVDEGIEILTGVKAGEPLPDGSYEDSTVHARVDKRLRELAEEMKKYEAGSSE